MSTILRLQCYVGRKRQYPDPFYATNREKTAYLSQNQINLIEEAFILKNELDNDNIILSCKMLDTLLRNLYQQYFNRKGQNAYIGYEFDIKKMLFEKEKTI